MAKQVKPIPDGARALTIHLNVRDAAKMIEFYKKVFGAKEMSRFMDPDGKTVMHAMLTIGDSQLMLNDEFPPMKCYSPLAYEGTGSSIYHYVDNVDETFQRAVKAGATVVMPIQDMFWGDRYGLLKDPSGHVWELATHKEDLSPAEMAKRGEEAMAKSPECV